jgi:hypothetical protein
VSRSLSYADAVVLLDGRSGRITTALDRLTGGLLLATVASGAGFVLGLFDVKSELVRLSDQLVSSLAERSRGLGRFNRGERLLAGHAIIVVCAYFETLAQINSLEADISRDEQVALVSGKAPLGSGPRQLAEQLLRADVPAPAPHRSFEDTLSALHAFYRQLSATVLNFLSGLSIWDALDETKQNELTSQIRNELPDRAIARYEQSFRRLALECPEIALWANQVDHQATRKRLDIVGMSLAGIEARLPDLVRERKPRGVRESLARTYRAALNRPALDSNEAPAEVRIPSLADSYVDPDFRVAEVGPSDNAADESWWNQVSVRSDLTEFLVGYLTSPAATTAPLLVLGQPGAGKSVLTKVLAARLPASDFLVVRVPLRDAPADTDLLTQVEYGIRNTTGHDLNWPELTGSADGALPVVLLDGFDELLQATGVVKSDYLQNIVAFQRREADRGNPVAVLVTTRIAVADRARPVPGLIALRLEPFSDQQVDRWLTVWNAINVAPSFRPLPTATVLRQGELASQPLLLLLLAIYDADDTPLQRQDAELHHADLYDRLLRRFAEREVLKAGAGLPDDIIAREVDRELLRLSVVAFAMFSRRRQWVSEAELNADLAALFGNSPPPAPRAGFSAELTAAQVVVGRFFFIHETRATRHDVRLRTYEFLHATFGEYLIARAISRELHDLAKDATRADDRSRPSRADDDFLHALLSFAPLSRGSALPFFDELVAMSNWEFLRTAARSLLISLFQDSLESRLTASYDAYRPTALAVPSRHALYAANLLLLTVSLSGDAGVTASELFPRSGDVKSQWHTMALLWRSQLPPEGFTSLVRRIDVRREWHEGHRNLRITHATPNPDLTVNPYWTYDHPPGASERGTGPTGWYGWKMRDVDGLRRQERFLCGHDEDVLLHAVEPLLDAIPDALVGFGGYWPDRAPSAVNALLRLLLMPPASDPARLIAAYHASLVTNAIAFGPDDTTRPALDTIVLRRLATDLPQLDYSAVIEMLSEIQSAGIPSDQHARFIDLAKSLLPTEVWHGVKQRVSAKGVTDAI